MIAECQIVEIDTDLTAFEIYKCFNGNDKSFFLDSSMLESSYSRFSVIGFEPFLFFESKGKNIKVKHFNEVRIFNGNPFDELDILLKTYRAVNNTNLPFAGGAVGYFAYDLCQHLEKLPKRAVDDIDLPDMAVGFYDKVIVVEHDTKRTFLSIIDFSFNDGFKLHSMFDRINTILNRSKNDNKSNLRYVENEFHPISNFSKEEYVRIINKAKEYIRNGDIYQVNLSQRFKADIYLKPIEIYNLLRINNPAPFAAYLEYDGYSVLSSSPERFLKIEGSAIESRPIKGTMPRGKDVTEDREKIKVLRESQKDMAENLMIVDLMRNDLGRVCKIGTITVKEIFKIETYATVHHLVSTVEGELRKGVSSVECIKATFPGGSITGAPKIRAMQIIDELEPTARSVYTGSIGYIGFNGAMDLNIAIRTIIIRGKNAYYQVGGGIVWDSDPILEYEETLHKGQALMKTLTLREEE